MSRKHAIAKTTNGKRHIKKREIDRVSELPDDILSSIISYFTVRDAANASVLSTRWRDLCASYSKLDFDLNNMFPNNPNHKDCNIERSCSMDICQQYKERFVRGVNQFLEDYQGTRLVSFRVELCLEKDSTCDVDQWVRFAFRMGVECLKLSLSCSDCYIYDERSGDKDFYTLRSELFLQGNVAKLQRLFISSCILGPGVITHFSGLKSLELAAVSLGQHEVEVIGSCCSTLEFLALTSCTLPPIVCISGSLQRLKFLGFASCLGVEKIELSATNLTRFDFDGSLITFSFSEVPNLKRIYVGGPDPEVAEYVFTQLAKDLPLVKTLIFFSAINWGKCLSEDITTFRNVKELEFFSHKQSNFDTLKIFAILKACPLLEKLNLVFGIIYRKEGTGQLSTPLKSVHGNLKQVHIGGFRFKPSYIDVARYMLEYVAALEQMVIDPNLKFYCGLDNWVFGRETWDEGEREKFNCTSQVALIKLKKADRFVDVLESISTKEELSLSTIFGSVRHSGDTLLHVAVSHGHEEIVRLIKNDCSSILMRKNSNGDTVWHIAAKIRNYSIFLDFYHLRESCKNDLSYADNRKMKRDVTWGDLSLRATNKEGNTALHEALIHRNESMADKLVKADEEVMYHLNNENKSALYLAAEAGYVKCLLYMLQNAARNGNQYERLKGKPLVHAAIMGRKIDVLRFLLKIKA